MSGSNGTLSREEHDPLNATTDNEEEIDCENETVWSSRNVILSKCLLAGVVLYAALLAYVNNGSTQSLSGVYNQSMEYPQHRRRLTAVMGEKIPSYMKDLNEDLKARNNLFEDTPPEEVKYWFEYTGPLQVSQTL